MKIFRLFTVTVLTVMLAACGEKSGDTKSNTVAPATQAAYIDKYNGVWKTVCLTRAGASDSGHTIFTISMKSDSVLTLAMTATRFSGNTCTGPALPNIFPIASYDITYVATVSDIDRFTYAAARKSSLKITGSRLNVGNESNLNAAGYPVIEFKDLGLEFIKN